jgi:hypothetical protein
VKSIPSQCSPYRAWLDWEERPCDGFADPLHAGLLAYLFRIVGKARNYA